MTQPIVGITTSHVADSVLPNDRLSSSYILAIRDAGGMPVLLPNLGDAAALDLLDALVISGGGDFDPASFGQTANGAKMAGVSAERDETELALLREAPPDLPILGICRGIQALAVAYGGTLIQDVPTERPSDIVHAQEMGRDARTHGVTIEAGSQLAQTLGATAIRVNSFHHQAVDRLPEGFRAVAWADDGLLEGMELPARPFCLGVQWHPENLTGNEEHARRLFAAVIQAAEVYRRRRRSQEAG